MKKAKKCKDEESKESKEDRKPLPRKCKGIKKSVIKKSIAHEDYKRCLSTGKNTYER